MIDSSKLANTFDYENYAREFLARPTFDHLQGPAILRHEDTIADYDRIKLKALGMMNMERMQGTSTKLLG